MKGIIAYLLGVPLVVIILLYVADITVNGHPETAGRPKPAAELRAPKAPESVHAARCSSPMAATARAWCARRPRSCASPSW